MLIVAETMIQTSPASIGNTIKSGKKAYVSLNLNSGTYPVARFDFKKASPKPRLRLKYCPAKQPVIAILARPLLATDAFVIVSPTEFPQARIVRPRYASGIPHISPISPSKSIKTLDIKLIQPMATKNPHKAKRSINHGGFEACVVK